MIPTQYKPLLTVVAILSLGGLLSYVLGLLMFNPSCVEGDPCDPNVVLLANVILGGVMLSWIMGIYHHFVVFHKISEITPGDWTNKLMWSCFSVCGFFAALTVIGLLFVFVLPFTFEEVRTWANNANETITNFDLYVIFPWQVGNILFGFVMMFVYLRLAYIKGVKQNEDSVS